MTKWQYRVQSGFWRLVSGFVPTCFLQSELMGRDGVESKTVGVVADLEVSVTGPCTVTINRD